MNRHDAFNILMTQGFDYSHYISRSDKHLDKYPIIWNSAKEDINKLDTNYINKLNQSIKVLVIGENWCGDCVKGIPVIAALAEIMTNWDFKIVGKDDVMDDNILDHYKTAGRAKIPVIIFADEDGDEVTRWVERPRRSYHTLVKLQKMRLPKEEFIAKFKSTPELKLESVAKETLREFLEIVDYVTSVLFIMPKKKKILT